MTHTAEPIPAELLHAAGVSTWRKWVAITVGVAILAGALGFMAVATVNATAVAKHALTLERKSQARQIAEGKTIDKLTTQLTNRGSISAHVVCVEAAQALQSGHVDVWAATLARYVLDAVVGGQLPPKDEQNSLVFATGVVQSGASPAATAGCPALPTR